MTVFIAHAPQDQTAAESLAEKLRQRAFLVELETGERATRPLSASDAVVGLISKDFVFSPYKLRLEKRLLDAWANGQLLQVKLDHSFAPVGLRDLPAIDASFEAQREFTWGNVADSLRALRKNPFGNAVDMNTDTPAPPPPPMAQAPASPAPAGPTEEWTQNQTNSYDGAGYDRVGAPRRRIASKKGGGFGFALLLALLIGGGVAGYFAFFGAQAPQITTPAGPSDQPVNPTPPPDYPYPAEAMLGFQLSQPVIMAAAIVIGLLIMAFIAISASRKAALERRMGKPSRADNARGITINEPSYADAAAPAPKPASTEPLVFISYARADQTSVDPLAKAVKDSGHAIWIDTDAINAGTSWAGEIVRAIKSAGHVLIMCSPRSFESDQVKREIYLADRYKKPLLPVFLEAAEPPEDFEYFFAGVQWLKLHESPEADRPGILARALPAA